MRMSHTCEQAIFNLAFLKNRTDQQNGQCNKFYVEIRGTAEFFTNIL